MVMPTNLPPYPKPAVRREWIDATCLEDASQRLILGAVVVPPDEPYGCCCQCGAPHEFERQACGYCLTPYRFSGPF